MRDHNHQDQYISSISVYLYLSVWISGVSTNPVHWSITNDTFQNMLLAPIVWTKVFYRNWSISILWINWIKHIIVSIIFFFFLFFLWPLNWATTLMWLCYHLKCQITDSFQSQSSIVAWSNTITYFLLPPVRTTCLSSYHPWLGRELKLSWPLADDYRPMRRAKACHHVA
jgi:hypothetical protein